MGLDIIAYNNKFEFNKKKQKFTDKYHITPEQFDELTPPTHTNFAYYKHPEQYSSDLDLYVKMANASNAIWGHLNAETTRFHISYSAFDRLRRDLAKPVNIRYIFKDHIYYPDNIANTALSDFFEHDCDGSFSASQISKAFKLYYELADRKQLNELFKDDRVKDFLQFVDNSTKNHLNWEFC